MDSFENARSAVLNSDIDPICITIFDFITCFFRYPPCSDFKLILPCTGSCGELIGFYASCSNEIAEHINDTIIRDHFIDLRCRVTDTYYIGYEKSLFDFDDDICIDIPNGLFNYRQKLCILILCSLLICY